MSRGDLYTALRGDRAVEHTGILHLDREAARQKMSAFTLPAPYYWVLQIVRVATLSDATRVEFAVTLRAVEVRFDATLDPKLLEEIWNVALDPRVTRHQQAIRYLALGVSAARALGPKELIVRSGAVELVCDEDGEHTRPLQTPVDGTVVRCLEKFRLAHVTDFLTELVKEPAELAVLRDFARYAPLTIVANEQPISREYHEARPLDLGTVYLHPTREQALDSYITVGGVRVHHTRHESLEYRGYEGFGGWALVLESPTLPLDLSTMSLAQHGDQDAATLTLVTRLQLWEHFRSDRSRILNLTAPERRSLFAMVLHQNRAPGVSALIEVLLTIPMFEACGESGALIALDQTIRDDPPHEPTKDRQVCFSSENITLDLTDDGPPIAWITDSVLHRMLMWHGVPVHDMTAQLRAYQARDANRARWRLQPEITLEGVIVRDPHFLGSVALATRGDGAVRFCKDRRIVAETVLAAPLIVQIDGPLVFNTAFDEVVPTEELRAFVETLILAIPQAFEGMDESSAPWSVATAASLIESVSWSRLDDLVRRAAKFERTATDERSWLERLGALADVPVVTLDNSSNHAGKLATVRTILTAEPPPLIGPVRLGRNDSAQLVLAANGALTTSMCRMRPEIQTEEERWRARTEAQRRVVQEEEREETERVLALLAKELADNERQLAELEKKLKEAEEEEDVWGAVAQTIGTVTIGEGVSINMSGSVSISGNLVFEPVEPVAPTPPALAPIATEHVLTLNTEEHREAARSGELHRVYAMLAKARDDRHELLGDFMLHRLSVRSGSNPWTVEPDGASIGGEHPLAALRHSADPIETAFLASGAATAINAYYRDFSDTHELQLQASLLRAPWGAA